MADDAYGDFDPRCYRIAVDRQKRLPPDNETPDEVLREPTGIRWSFGDWLQFPRRLLDG